MNILFIEDETSKSSKVISILKEKYKKCNVDVSRSIISGTESIQNKNYDLILLDMSLPLFDLDMNSHDNEFEAFGGIDILDELKRTKLKVKVIVITAFDILEDDKQKLTLDQLDIKMRNDYPNLYIGSIYFDISSLEWIESLIEYVSRYYY